MSPRTSAGPWAGGYFKAYSFVDDQYAKKFAAEQRIGNLAAVFTVLAIFISCLGLFGLAAFVAEQRTKEIGVRKVLGAGAGLLLITLITVSFQSLKAALQNPVRSLRSE